MLAPLAWQTAPRHYGPWELFASLLPRGWSRAATTSPCSPRRFDDHRRLHAYGPPGWSEGEAIVPKVAACIHIAEVFERADEFDVIHNGFDFLPLTYSGLVDTPV